MALPIPLSVKAGRKTGRNGAARDEPHLTCRTHRQDVKEQESDAHLSSRSLPLKAALPRLKDKLRSFNPLKRRAKGAEGRSIPAAAYGYLLPTNADECSTPIDASLLRQKLLRLQRLQEQPPSRKDAGDTEEREFVSADEGSASSPKRPFSRIRRWCLE